VGNFLQFPPIQQAMYESLKIASRYQEMNSARPQISSTHLDPPHASSSSRQPHNSPPNYHHSPIVPINVLKLPDARCSQSKPGNELQNRQSSLLMLGPKFLTSLKGAFFSNFNKMNNRKLFSESKTLVLKCAIPVVCLNYKAR